MSKTSGESHHSATPPPRFRYARQVFLAVSAAALAAILIAGHAVLLPFVLAALVGYVLLPAVRFVERGWMPRWVAILVVYVVAVGSMVGFSVIVVPRLFEEMKNLATELPRLASTVRDDYLPIVDERLSGWLDSQPSKPPAKRQPAIVLEPQDGGGYAVDIQRDLRIRRESDGTYVVGPPQPADHFSSERVLSDAFDKAVSWAQKNSFELLAVGRAIVGGITRLVFYFFITLMLAGYMMYTWENIREFFRELWPKYRRSSFDRFLHRLDRGLAGVVRGQLLICLVNGVLSAIGFWFFELSYWPILALIAGVLSIIPIFGSILSSVPAVAIGLTQGLGVAVGVLVWIVAIHQLEANFLNPKIIGDAAKIHPVLVVFALLFGQHFFGITGALLAVPTLALVQAVFLHFRQSVLGISSEPLPAAGSGPAPGEPSPEAPTPRPATAPPAPDEARSADVNLDDSAEVDTERLQTRRSPSKEGKAAEDTRPATREEREEAQRRKKELTQTLKSHSE